MAYIGNNAVTQQFVPGADRFSGDGSTTAFTLSRPVGSVFDIQVSVDNVIQDPYTAYGVNGQTLTFTGAPLVGSFNIQVVYRSLVTQTIKPGAGTITTEAFSNQAINNVAIGSTTASTGRFTDLTDTGLTATRITYAGTGGNLVDSANLTFNGTTLTAAALTVSGATALNGGTTLGDASGDALTINSSAVSIPNGLNFDSNTFVIDATNNNVGIGTSSPTDGLLHLNGGTSTNIKFTNATTGTTASDGFYVGLGTSIDRDAYIYQREASNIIFATSNTERMRIDSSGNVGLGTNSPTTRLNVQGIAGQAAAIISVPSTGATVRSNNTFRIQSEASGRDVHMQFSDNVANSTEIGMISGNQYFCTGATERMRIASDGTVLINQTSTPANKLGVRGGSGVIGITKQSDTGAAYYGLYTSTGTLRGLFGWGDATDNVAIAGSSGNLTVDGIKVLFKTNTNPSGSWNANSNFNFFGGVQLTHTLNTGIWRQFSWSGDPLDGAMYVPGNAGNVASLTAAGAWTNASDGRFKENITTIKYGLDTVLKTKPSSYTRKDVSGNYIGFIAQELKQEIPEVVNGSDETQYGVDYGSLVAVAFKAIQEQQAIITDLKTRIEALENK